MTADNLFAVILGNKSSIQGGSGKVVDSGPDDRIFIYYADHGGVGVLGECLIAIDSYIILRNQDFNNCIDVMHSESQMFLAC